MVDEVKVCPDCAERVLAEAKVCKHCGYRFDQYKSDVDWQRKISWPVAAAILVGVVALLLALINLAG